MSDPKKWQAGRADTVTKVIICARDMHLDENCLAHMIYVLTDAGNDRELGLRLIRNLSGAQIVDGLLAHIASCRQSVEAGLRTGGEK